MAEYVNVTDCPACSPGRDDAEKKPLKSLANEMAPKGIACVVIHPGHVRTDMGGPTAPVLAPDSAAGMRAVVEKLTLETTASFTNFDGSPIPW